MKNAHEPEPRSAALNYAVLRHGGASRSRARAELEISPARADELEALFRIRRPGKSGDGMRPRFARHDAHVAAVLQAGGYPAIGR